MKIDYDLLDKKLVEAGMNPGRTKAMIRRLKYSEATTSYSCEQQKWALERGFVPDKIDIWELNDQNYSEYLSDFDYLMMHPLNNHFAIWINDKLTLKYMLNSTSLKSVMPEYYLYVENDGHYSYLMDAPNDIPRDSNFIINLLKKKRILAVKLNRGERGVGFMKVELNANEKIEINGKLTSEEEFKNIVENQLNGYIVTEFIYQHSKLDEIWSKSSCALRIILCKIQKERLSMPEYKCCTAYARFGTELSGGTCNLSQGGVGVPFDFETGKFYENGIKYKVFCPDGNYKFSSHPDTDFVFKDFILPNYEIVKKHILDTCNYLSSLDYFGFDVIITENDAKFCEINSLPAFDYEQLMCGPGLRNPEIREFFCSKKRFDYPENLLWQLVESCLREE